MGELEQRRNTGWVSETELGHCGPEAIQPQAILPSSKIKRKARHRLGPNLWFRLFFGWPALPSGVAMNTLPTKMDSNYSSFWMSNVLLLSTRWFKRKNTDLTSFDESMLSMSLLLCVNWLSFSPRCLLFVCIGLWQHKRVKCEALQDQEAGQWRLLHHVTHPVQLPTAPCQSLPQWVQCRQNAF